MHIQCNRAHRPMSQWLIRRRCAKIRVRHPLDGLLIRQAFGPAADQQDMRGAFKDRARQGDWIAHALDARHRSDLRGNTVHHHRIEQNTSFGVTHRSTSGIQHAGILHRGHRDLYRIQGRTTGRQHRHARRQCRAQSRFAALAIFRIW